MGSCYQGARLYEANDECTEDEAEAGQVLLGGTGGVGMGAVVVSGMDVVCCSIR
jgi:hypothetical protein